MPPSRTPNENVASRGHTPSRAPRKRPPRGSAAKTSAPKVASSSSLQLLPPCAFSFLARKAAPQPWNTPGGNLIFIDRENMLYHLHTDVFQQAGPEAYKALSKALKAVHTSRLFGFAYRQIKNDLASEETSNSTRGRRHRSSFAKVVLVECSSLVLLNVLSLCDPVPAKLYGYLPPPITEDVFFLALRDVDSLRLRIAIPLLKRSLRDLSAVRAYRLYFKCRRNDWAEGAAIAAMATFSSTESSLLTLSTRDLTDAVKGRAHEFRDLVDYTRSCGRVLGDRIIKPVDMHKGKHTDDPLHPQAAYEVPFLMAEDADVSAFRCRHRPEIPLEHIQLGDGSVVAVNRWLTQGLRTVQAKFVQRPSTTGARAAQVLIERGTRHCKQCVPLLEAEVSTFVRKLDAVVDKAISEVPFKMRYNGPRQQWVIV